MSDNSVMEINKPYFDKNTTNIIKGVALIMMFFHHFFNFPSWWGEGISYPLLAEIAPFLGVPLKICVPVFCFITGYLYSIKDDKTYKYSLRKITDILIPYWFIFLIAAAIAYFGLNYQYSPEEFVKELFGLTYKTMTFNWYVSFYIVFMLIMPLVSKVMSKNAFLDVAITFVFIPALISYLNSVLHGEIAFMVIGDLKQWFPCVLMGVIFARYNVFQSIQRVNEKIIKYRWLRIIIWIAGFFAFPMWRAIEPVMTINFWVIPECYILMDVFYAPLFIYSLVNLTKEINLKILNKSIEWIGKYSLLMWFVSCIFFSNSKTIFQPILYAPRFPLLVLLWGLLICFVIAYAINLLTSRIQKFKNDTLFK